MRKRGHLEIERRRVQENGHVGNVSNEIQHGSYARLVGQDDIQAWHETRFVCEFFLFFNQLFRVVAVDLPLLLVRENVLLFRVKYSPYHCRRRGARISPNYVFADMIRFLFYGIFEHATEPSSNSLSYVQVQ